MKSSEGQAAIAEAIARGVVEWAGLAWRASEAPAAPRPGPVAVPRHMSKPAVTVDKLYVVQAGAFRDRGSAEALAKQLRAKGFSALVVVREA